jgi:hypothetical protein
MPLAAAGGMSGNPAERRAAFSTIRDPPDPSHRNIKC